MKAELYALRAGLHLPQAALGPDPIRQQHSWNSRGSVGKADIYDPRVDVRGAVTINASALNVLTGRQFPAQLNGANIRIEGAGPVEGPNE